jgi:hypothetical protein
MNRAVALVERVHRALDAVLVPRASDPGEVFGNKVDQRG